MKTGQLKHRVTLQRSTTIHDLGQTKLVWSVVGDFWAFVKPVLGSETPDVKGTQPIVTYAVTLRNVGEITPRDRLLFQGRILNIESAINVEQANTHWLLTCKHLPNSTRAYACVASGGLALSGEASWTGN